MKTMKYICILLLALPLLLSCDKTEGESTGIALGSDIHFTAGVNTRADGPLTTSEEVTIIAPGYGVDATNQKSVYTASNGTLTLIDRENNDKIKRSAKNMVFTAWTAPTGVDVDAGTVDFTKDLGDLIGARMQETDPTSNNITLAFTHLVAKVSIIVYNITTGSPVQVTGASIAFPAIKQIGNITTVLEEDPKVVPGKSGNSLEVKLDDRTGSDDVYTTAYLPPMSANEILMYGSFTVRVGGTTYVGTLNNLQLTGGIGAGDHAHIVININDDHTALLQAITLAPWDEYPKNLYNRPTNGIWGMEDLQNLARLINQGATIGSGHKVDGYKLENFCQEEDGRQVIRQYTNITFTSDDEFIPIGTLTHPFSLVFDGNGYTTAGAEHTENRINDVALFGYTEDAIIRNVIFKDCYLDGVNNVAAIVGYAGGTTRIEHCQVYGGRLYGDTNVGGLVGFLDAGAKIFNSRVEMNTVSGEKQVGGFVGRNEGFIGNSCSIVDNVSCSEADAGGFVGMNAGTIENAFSKAYFTIVPPVNCGAWVGNNTTVAVTNRYCYWNNDCIENGYCTLVVGNNTEKNPVTLLEDFSKMVSGRKYYISNGRFMNDAGNYYSSLRDQLNTNIGSLAKTTEYIKWAKIANNVLPIFSYGED